MRNLQEGHTSIAHAGAGQVLYLGGIAPSFLNKTAFGMPGHGSSWR